jgi:predicted cobalt transporter CbtA
MTESLLEEPWALTSLVCAVTVGAACAVAASSAGKGREPADGARQRLLWALAGLVALVVFPLIGSAV